MSQAAFNTAHLTANGPTLIKTGIGVCGMVTINTKGAAGNTLTVYDGIDATGVIIGIIDTTGALGTYLWERIVVTGIFAVMAGGTPADATISWY